MVPSYLYQFHVEEDEGRPRRIKGVGGPSALSVSKFLQEVVLLPPDAAVSVSKFLQEVVLLPPDAAVSVSKAVVYVVLELVPPSLLPGNPRARQAVFQAYELEEEFPRAIRRAAIIPTPSSRRSIRWMEFEEGPDHIGPRRHQTPVVTDDSITFLCIT